MPKSRKRTSSEPRTARSKRGRAATADQNDPHAAREASRYSQPIASREFILEHLRDVGAPLTFTDVREALDIHIAAEVDGLRRRLRAMCRDGQLMLDRQGRYCLVDKLDLVRGTVTLLRDGAGLLRSDDGDVPIRRDELRGIIDGDVVLARVQEDGAGAVRVGAIVEVVERPANVVVGLLWEDGGAFFVQPEKGQINEDVIIPPEHVGGANPGDYVLARLPLSREPGHRPVGEVIEILGPPEQAGVEREVILQAHRIPRDFSRGVMDQLKEIEALPAPGKVPGRVDLRDLKLVTIDGESARDFDDAVYAEARARGGWRLIVAIADVAHYVLPGSELDLSAQTRGNSVYFPDMVIPMLPEMLSNGLCSLRPHEDRLCLVCDMNISAAGRVTKYTFYEGVMNSAARLTYTQVGAALGMEGVDDIKPNPETLAMMPQIEALNGVYTALRQQREKRGALDFSSNETRIVFNTEGRIDRIEPVTRNDANKLIEECMISANVCAAKLLLASPIPAPYRDHEPPEGDKLVALAKYLSFLGLQMNASGQPKPREVQDLIEQAQQRPGGHVVETLVLRSMKQAVYAAENLGHFGLALEAYTHFTSPIRRYADLLVHRAIRHLIRQQPVAGSASAAGGALKAAMGLGKGANPLLRRVRGAKRLTKAASYPYSEGILAGLCDQISMTERRAETAVRDLDNWLKCDYMRERIGETFEATVASVVHFGVFVELDGLYVSGLVHISTLGKDYFHFDERRMELRGENSGQTFVVGDRMTVQLARVDIFERRMDFVPEDMAENSRGSQRSAGGSGARGSRNKNAGSGRHQGGGKSQRGRRRR